jgi:hypothetical protein
MAGLMLKKREKTMQVLIERSVETPRSPSIATRSLAEPLEACRPQEGLRTKTPKHPELLGRTIRRAPHREAFISDVKS